MNLKLIFLSSTILVYAQIQGLLCQPIDSDYQTCNTIFRCGKINELRYPFWGEDRSLSCGHPEFKLLCQGDNAVITIESINYLVLSIDDTSRTINVSRQDLLDPNVCPTDPRNTTLDWSRFRYSSASGDKNITLNYDCDVAPGNLPPVLHQRRISCDTKDKSFYCTPELVQSLGGNSNFVCGKTILVPVKKEVYLALSATSPPPPPLQSALESGFSIEWLEENRDCEECRGRGGICGYNRNSESFACYCSDGPCNGKGKGSSNKAPLIIGLSVGGSAGLLAIVGLGCFIFFYKRRSKSQVSAKSVQDLSQLEIASNPPPPPSSRGLSSISGSTNEAKSIPSYPTSKSDLGRGSSSYFGLHVFNFAELEDATNNFDPSRELGDGGFGTVYYGVLADGRAVAVKRLYENNVRRVEQFMNEVRILTSLRHKNLVLLYGCTSKSSRNLMLVYEYISNGTVADHLHGKRAKSCSLSWPVRLNIAIETADALAYLHRSDIIHRDVKTNNVLLDQDFHVKVADFGLSRLFPLDVTHVSTAPQGTPGYVDPEYHQCYQLTEKSDVYSFGVMLVELVSSLQAVDTSRHRHDINLSNMAVSKIQNRMLHELVDPNLGFETSDAVRRAITQVAGLAFQCLQRERDMRPSMEDVLEKLEMIRNCDLKEPKVEVNVEMLVDDDEEAYLRGRVMPRSPETDTTSKWTSSSTAYSSV